MSDDVDAAARYGTAGYHRFYYFGEYAGTAHSGGNETRLHQIDRVP